MRSRGGLHVPLLLALALGSCRASEAAPEPATPPAPVECQSLLGAPLRRPELSPTRANELERDLVEARARSRARPDDPAALVWVGRRLAYLGRYREATSVYTGGIERFPDHAPLYRHRGHRLITLRDFAAGEADLEHAADLMEGAPDSIEPDGAPNAAGIPRSTAQSNIWYHLGLARYLQGDFAGAESAWDRCLVWATVNDDMLVATLYWAVQARLAEGRMDAALALVEPVHPELEVLENHAYLALLLMVSGQLSESQVLADAEGEGSLPGLEFATRGYGVASWRRARGDDAGARVILERIVSEAAWPSFGHIAAEADLARAETRSSRRP